MRDIRDHKKRWRLAGTNTGAVRATRWARLLAKDKRGRATRPRSRRAVPWLVAVPAVLAALLTAGAAAGLRLNVTESLPLGLYQASAFRPETASYGELVTFCPRRGALTAVAPYLLAGDDCAGGNGRIEFAELAKALAGLPGDTVIVSAQGVRVNGVPLPHSEPLAHSRSGAPVVAALGTHVLGLGEYWMHSGRVRYSLDSRYYGPVTDVRRQLRPAVTSGAAQALDPDWHPSHRQ